MLCPKCGYYNEKEEDVCPSCGNILNHPTGTKPAGAEAIRQGKKAREAVKRKPVSAEETEARKRRSGASHAVLESDTDKTESHIEESYFDSLTVSENSQSGAGYERRRRALYDEETDAEQAARYAAPYHGKPVRRRMVNWIKLGIIISGVVIVLIAVTLGYLRLTTSGQLFVTKMALAFPGLNLPVHSSALWTLGEEYMNQGEIQKAIRCCTMAQEMNADEKVYNVDGLMMLGNAYEAAGQIDDAMSMYYSICNEIPTRPEAYKALIRILQTSGKEGDLTLAGELMKTAYEKTQENVFKNQRDVFLPIPPETNLTAGYYEVKEHITLSSQQGFDIYFTFQDDADLPSGGTKFTEPILLEEGAYHLRAVCVNGELVSDELKATYRISMPSPRMPQCNLAPKTYKTRQTVRLKPGKDNIGDDDIRIYYTIDGSPPDLDSPLYKTGETIKLPTGNVTLQAVAVNQYQKTSNPLVVNYKIDVKPRPKSAFTSDDMISSIRFGTTTQLEFFETFGQGEPEDIETSEEYGSEIRRYQYPWGYAVMNLVGRKTKTWVIVELDYSSEGKFSAPRNTGIGDTEESVVDKYRDMGQVENATSHNRGLYYNDKGMGKIWQTDQETRIIRYVYTGDSHTLQLEYYIQDGHVIRINMRYVP